MASKSYTNSRTGAVRQSGSTLGYPYIETSKLDRANAKTTKSGPTAEKPTTSTEKPTGAS